MAKIDRDYEISKMAFERRRIEAKQGSKRQTYVYKSLKSFYDYDKNIEEVRRAFSKNENTGNEQGLNFKALIEKRKKEEK